ncbi:hypothetical protein [Flavobacterium nitrogenifigens]|uniref:DUF3592 domain-containing protein n=1 Tax=Flavobacterium nitrogenifigens TaxID=1617283 RepID=A0A521EYM3_9FLAO|nr:hypothetical protein [Flavobacterium nitrogenifigens]KAF2336120.1 hypothetical protein DM397_06185 [Flavobacterium nitrogenifigens]SMO88995.1 hypothetical protein SAMN06265220_105280 [Flavobacterium nitrogenifigens]
MTSNNVYYRRWVRLIGAFSTFFALIGFFPAIGDIGTILYYKDIYIHYDKYQKKHIVIDSLTYLNTDGNDKPRVDGYSKDLNNYKTIILLDKNRNEESEIDSLGNAHMDVWHRNGIDFAYPAMKKDKMLPAKKIFYQKAKVPLLWLLSIIITFIMYKIMKKSKLFEGFDH